MPRRRSVGCGSVGHQRSKEKMVEIGRRKKTQDCPQNGRDRSMTKTQSSHSTTSRTTRHRKHRRLDETIRPTKIINLEKEKRGKKRPTTKTRYHHLKGKNFEDWAQEVMTGKVTAMIDEYDKIRQEKSSGHRSTDAFADNMDKNRYGDVGLFDQTRVKLMRRGCDYIHASYVDSWDVRKGFICTQGPLDTTIGDFWAMVWQESCLAVVQLCNPKENGRSKCAGYWHPCPGNAVTGGEYEVKTVAQTEIKEYDHLILKTTLQLRRGRDERTIIHFHHTSWPDKSFPKSAGPMIKLMYLVKESVKEVADKGEKPGFRHPIVIHCSAGIGRTGTLVAIDICYQRWINTKQVDIAAVVKIIREQRMLAVQTEAQYVYIYRALLENALQKGHLKETEFDYTALLRECKERYDELK